VNNAATTNLDRWILLPAVLATKSCQRAGTKTVINVGGCECAYRS